LTARERQHGCDDVKRCDREKDGGEEVKGVVWGEGWRGGGGGRREWR